MRIILIWLFLLLSACSGDQLDALEYKETIPSKLQWQSPNFEGEVIQLLQGRFKQKNFVFQSRLSIRHSGIKVIILDTFGQRLAEAYWSEQGVDYKTYEHFPKTISMHHIFRDMVYSFWPVDRLKDIDNSIQHVEVDGRQRVIHQSEMTHVIIHSEDSPNNRWQQNVTLVNEDVGYKLIIHSQKVGA
ncbi:DUF3261 domain-containing protein [Curvivirga aplysinae]|uniref:DUF3261 domain-containing protein n=1 Tax=Curvivirga aplysinae TaxID=2529852 RepID=UPI0012BD715C|nr:DUF3261 domain-containing protein [Curvivirga aplysinae]MTI11024.1 DUF3261 domain-containing protein [Curvivirga aplysinae]